MQDAGRGLLLLQGCRVLLGIDCESWVLKQGAVAGLFFGVGGGDGVVAVCCWWIWP